MIQKERLGAAGLNSKAVDQRCGFACNTSLYVNVDNWVHIRLDREEESGPSRDR